MRLRILRFARWTALRARRRFGLRADFLLATRLLTARLFPAFLPAFFALFFAGGAWAESSLEGNSLM